MASPASNTRQKYTHEVEMEMWEFFLKKLRRGDPDVIGRRYHVWKEYEVRHPERTWQNYESHFRKQMITRLADYALNKEDMIRVLQKCNVKLDQWQSQRKALQRGLNCKLFVERDGTVSSCLPLKDHAEEDGATTSAEKRRPSGQAEDGGSDTEDAQDDSDSSVGPAAEAHEANDVEGPDNVDLLELTDDDEELSLCLSEEEPEEIGGSQPANSDASAPLGVQSEQVESGQESQNEKGAAVSAIQAGSSSSAPTPDSSSSVALPVIQPGMSYEEQKRICHQRMKLVLEGVTEPLSSELVGMFRAVLKAEGFNYDPDPTETDWLSSLHPPPRKLPRKDKKSS